MSSKIECRFFFARKPILRIEFKINAFLIFFDPGDEIYPVFFRIIKKTTRPILGNPILKSEFETTLGGGRQIIKN